MYITYTISLSVLNRASSFHVEQYVCICIYIDLLAAHNDEGCPANIYIYIHIFQVLMPRKRPACIIAIMDNSKDLKMHTCRQVNERLNHAPQICSLSPPFFSAFDLENYRLVFSISLSPFFSGCCINKLLIDQSVQERINT